MQNNLFALLDELKIRHKTYQHQPFFTCEQVKAEGAHIPGAWCKNLFLKDSKKKMWLISALADTDINLKRLGKHIDAPELRFANEELLLKYLGVKPGSVTPFGLIHDDAHAVNVILDKALFVHRELGFHPLSNDATTIISPQDLQKFVATRLNPYQILDFTTLMELNA